jgi:peptide/nickel transport system permease protein
MSEESWNMKQVSDFDAEAAADDDRIPAKYQHQVGEETEGSQTRLQRLVEEGLTNKKTLVGTIAVLAFLLTAVFAPILAPYNPDVTYEPFQPLNSYSVGDFDSDPGTERIWHPLGTDSFGHDMLSRIIFGARVSLLVALGTLIFAFVIGTTIGIAAGYYKGWIDDVLMRLVDFQWAFPELILAIAIIAFAGGRGVWVVVLAIGIAYIDDFARLIRGEVLAIRENEYIRAAEAVGMSDLRIMSKEVLPNTIAPLIVQASIMIPLAIIAEASLSFLGLGVKPTTPTWGLLVGQGRQFIARAWWISVIPGLAIMVTVLGFNLLGDGLRTIFDVEESEVESR